MFLHTTTSYAIQIMIEIAKSKSKISSSALAENTGISQKYLKKITLRLREDKLLHAIPGHYGGYVLAKPPEEITMWDIIQSIEPGFSVYETRDESNGLVQNIYSDMNQLIQSHFSSITLAELVDKLPRECET